MGVVATKDTIHNQHLACLHEIFEETARRTPTAIAVRCSGESITYDALDSWSNGIATRLIGYGVVAGQPVGICLPNGAAFAAAVLAVLKAGCVLLPLDIREPSARLCALLDDVSATLVIAKPEITSTLLGRTILDADTVAPVRVGPHNGRSPSPESPAYILFTSGSTGQRKCVVNPHIGVSSHLAWLSKEIILQKHSPILMRTGHGFDVWLLEFFWALSGGHQLVMARTEESADPARLLCLIRDENIVGLCAVPELLRRLTAQSGFLALDKLRYVFAAGEVLDSALARSVNANPNVTLYNLYGPTEASIIATYFEVRRDQMDDPIPIGRPLPRISIHILDEMLRVLPQGQCGEIYISGIAVGAGYLQEISSSESFIDAIPGLNGSRFFRTGDLGYVREDGELIFCGRNTGEAKLNGVRMETSNLESALRYHRSVLDCAVAVKTVHDGTQRLLAYVVPRGGEFDASALAAYLRHCRPDALAYPSSFLIVDSLPLLPNGKHDYGALPVPCRFPRAVPVDYVAPRSALEGRLADLWDRQLHTGPIGVYDDYDDLGANPILAFDMIGTMAEQICAELKGFNNWKLSTISDIAEFIARRGLSVRGTNETTGGGESPWA